MTRRPNLDENTIIRTAAELIDDEGIDALNLAQLAHKLGVRTPSLYNHITGLDGVRHGLALYGIRELAARIARAAVGRSSADAIFACASAYRQFAHEHQGLYIATQRAPAPDDRELVEASEEIMQIIRDVLSPYDLRNATQIHAIRALRSLIHGFVLLELAGGFGVSVDTEQSFHVLINMFLAGLEHFWTPESSQ